jgi:thiamine transport system ATP-binding protein
VSSSEPVLEVERLATAWDGVPVLREVSFALRPRELLALLGPNGSGKTTLLRCLAGFERPTSGRILLDGVDLAGRPAHRRGIGLMSQEPALFPRRTVLENIAYAPLLKGRSEATVRAEVAELLALLRLEGFEERGPDQLSGGERQRVALARTLAARPRVVLLDEPFASIDVEGRAELRAEFRRVLRELGTAAIHVTHDREEGLFLGDRVGILLDGRLESLDRPDAVYAHPRSERSARLLGYGVLATPAGRIAVRPVDLRVVPAGAGRADATVLVLGTTGPEALTVLDLDAGGRVEVRGPLPAAGLAPGARVGVDWTRSVPLPG